jgi:hypothetical protein
MVYSKLEEQVVASDFNIHAHFKELLQRKCEIRCFFMKNTLYYLYKICADFEL